ncbi:hypothetical protein TSUD_162890 [Trifolium subterraneum]|uniref:3-oxo-5-alpha-steroid 4-dehydrogenase C-terminal domain-containing protein n=1 Tax=Trifolium subterraneum TaxID=3900 RepID=A0A2Z6MPB5_TRISU|nr:hypothetical protein TSUD_162890 [Trifolium subterraneum]
MFHQKMFLQEEDSLFNYALLTLFLIAPPTFISLTFLQAPYGKHHRPGWGPNLSPPLAWFLMESPTLWFTLYLFPHGEGKGYMIPKGGLFQVVSCPNYFGEIVEWFGWALMTWSWAGLGFFVYTFANLGPRARANHQWYLEKFGEDYPKKRKAVIPYLY